MAKPIIVKNGGATSSFKIRKLDRSKLYGKRQRQTLDPDGRRCERAELTRDGSMLVRSGMTAQAYFDDGGKWVPNSDLVGIGQDGKPVPLSPSTLGVAQALIGPVDPTEVFDLNLRSVYVLEPEDLDTALELQLKKGKVFKFPFNYRSDYNAETAYLVGNKEGYFALIGHPGLSEWCELETVAVDTFDGDDDDDDDLDFEMF
ncbi:MAG: hypothetical protein H6713_37705 [Myxococcales bacterium]|nr:hypothetical protein [Myxococcales bacterium]